MAKKRSRVQKARFVQPPKGSSKKQPAKKKGEQEEAGVWKQKLVYTDPQGNEFSDQQFKQSIQPIDLVDWEEDGPKVTNPKTGKAVERYKRFEPYGPPLGGGLA
ncbi:hypothetical protein F1728_25525 [Gimesia benthica]|uniref:Uncharacterized protein n=1 Tax=Gimesia benthica TaxID=2608982 RepID=A0A6I6AHF5_9PLAN|nr:hypothetical protein [Gimesia benthica]QGQ25827.1 hypothetical protein F1728_25525 [Gimesia benthica]